MSSSSMERLVVPTLQSPASLWSTPPSSPEQNRTTNAAIQTYQCSSSTNNKNSYSPYCSPSLLRLQLSKHPIPSHTTTTTGVTAPSLPSPTTTTTGVTAPSLPSPTTTTTGVTAPSLPSPTTTGMAPSFPPSSPVSSPLSPSISSNYRFVCSSSYTTPSSSPPQLPSPLACHNNNNSIILHVYDLEAGVSKLINGLVRDLGTGAYHAGVEIFQNEYYFGQTSDGSTGVCVTAPRRHPVHAYRESIHMGRTNISEEAFHLLMVDMRRKWPGVSYDLLSRNCLNFADHFCRSLGVGGIPEWTMSMQISAATAANHIAVAASALQDADEVLGVSKSFKALGSFLWQQNEEYGIATRLQQAALTGWNLIHSPYDGLSTAEESESDSEGAQYARGDMVGGWPPTTVQPILLSSAPSYPRLAVDKSLLLSPPSRGTQNISMTDNAQPVQCSPAVNVADVFNNTSSAYCVERGQRCGYSTSASTSGGWSGDGSGGTCRQVVCRGYSEVTCLTYADDRRKTRTEATRRRAKVEEPECGDVESRSDYTEGVYTGDSSDSDPSCTTSVGAYSCTYTACQDST
eukprot:GHVS01042642.1.p1 GENE.GHVS01042642.1~~GHVS01042642.1.p1  ORF type:complete len:572 (+),score=99.53 GHVS01042642.1:234-1949(+)